LFGMSGSTSIQKAVLLSNVSLYSRYTFLM
jgi:hypothetical protein